MTIRNQQSPIPNPQSHRIHRGVVISFDFAAWTALVTLDVSHAAVTLPVAHWLSSLAANQQVAVALFDDSNPGDGVVLCAFGGTPSA